MNLPPAESDKKYTNHQSNNARPLAWLRQSSQSLHAQLDTLPIVAKLLKKPVDRVDYQVFLQGMLAAYSKLEPQIESISSPLIDYQSRLPALHLELQQLSGQNITVKVDLQPTFSIQTEYELLGVCYVLDGSCHGAKIILPHLKAHLLQAQTQHFDYWQMLASQAVVWPNLCQNIERLADTDSAKQVVIQKAKETFSLFIDCLS